MKKVLSILLSLCFIFGAGTNFAYALSSADFVVEADSGYYAETVNSSEKEGIVAITAYFAKFADYPVSETGIMIYTEGNEKNEAKIAVVKTADSKVIAEITAGNGGFSALFTGIAAVNFGKEVIAKAFVVIDGDYYYSDAITTSVNADKWLGPKAKEEDEILAFTLLDDGTYGVKAGADAAKHTQITIPETYKGVAITQILTRGFQNITTLENIYIPSSVTKINSYAFYNCAKLTSVTIPTDVNYIGKYAFYNSGVTSVKLTDASGWRLENRIGANEWNLSWYYGSLEGGCRVVYDLTNTKKVADAFTKTVTLIATDGNLTFYNENAKLYTENWIKG